MKKALFARGFIGSLSLVGVMGAIGCSADVMDEGAAGEGEIGSVEQPIVIADVDDAATVTAFPLSVAFAASCVINEQDNGSGNSYLVVAGGQLTGSPTESDDAYLLDGNTWRGPFDFSSIMSGGTSHAAMITRPGKAKECLLFGGRDGNSKVGKIVKFTYTTSGGNPALTVSAAGEMLTPRSDFEVAAGPNNSVLVMGGNTGIASMEVWNGLLNSGAGPDDINEDLALLVNTQDETVTLNNGRNNFGIAQALASTTRMVVSGGLDSGGSRLDTSEAIELVANGTTGFKLNSTDPNPFLLSGAGKVITARHSLKGFHKVTSGSTDEYRFVAGNAAGNTASNVESIVTIDWSTLSSSSVSQANTIATATTAPAIAIFDTDRAFLFGGSVRNYQEHNVSDSPDWTSISTYDDGSTNLPLRLGATAQFVPGTNRVYVVGGLSGATFLSSVDAVEP